MKKLAVISVLLMAFFPTGCLETFKIVNFYTYFSERVTASYLRSRWFPFLETGVTTYEKVEEELGQPSCVFEDGRIYTYRLIINEWKEGMSETMYRRYQNAYRSQKIDMLESIASKRFERIDKEGSLLVISEENMESYEKEIISSIAEFHLVLVFNTEGVLSRYSLIRIRP